jgi:uncharacterized protein YjbI with pentapeptide repeats
LVDIALDEDLQQLLTRLGDAPQDYFYEFVNTIIERESVEKWIDRSGEPYKPLLSVTEHHELLGLIAHEMWLMNTEVLRTDLLDVVTEVFADEHRLSPVMLRQIKERLPHHSLLSAIGTRKSTVSFDHEDFRQFFLGGALARAMLTSDETDLRALLQVNLLPSATCDAAVQRVRREGQAVVDLVWLLAEISSTDVPTSFTRENCGALISRLLDRQENTMAVEGILFPADSLLGRQFHHIQFENCYFQPTSLADCMLDGCAFDGCTFERLELAASTNIANTTLTACEVAAVYNLDNERRAFDPSAVAEQLRWAGFQITAPSETLEIKVPPLELDELTSVTEKVIRMFLRATFINELPMRQNLGVRANMFFDRALPHLSKSGVFEEIPYRGSGIQRRLRLAMSLDTVAALIERSGGSFDKFVKLAEASDGS